MSLLRYLRFVFHLRFLSVLRRRKRILYKEEEKEEEEEEENKNDNEYDTEK